MILDSTFKLEAVLAGAVTANQPEFHVDYVVWNAQGGRSRPAPARGALNSTSDVTLLAASRAGEIKEPEAVAIYNKDTATITVTVKTDDGTTERIIIKSTVQAGRALMWEKGSGWYLSQ